MVIKNVCQISSLTTYRFNVKSKFHPGARLSCVNFLIKPVMRTGEAHKIVINLGTHDLPSDKSLVQICSCVISSISSIRDKNMDLVIFLVVSCSDGINENSWLVNSYVARIYANIGFRYFRDGTIRGFFHFSFVFQFSFKFKWK